MLDGLGIQVDGAFREPEQHDLPVDMPSAVVGIVRRLATRSAACRVLSAGRPGGRARRASPAAGRGPQASTRQGSPAHPSLVQHQLNLVRVLGAENLNQVALTMDGRLPGNPGALTTIGTTPTRRTFMVNASQLGDEPPRRRGPLGTRGAGDCGGAAALRSIAC